jgi:hypothetical protein
MIEYRLHDFQQLGFVDLVGTDVTSQCGEKDGMYHMPVNIHYVCHVNTRHIS